MKAKLIISFLLISQFLMANESEEAKRLAVAKRIVMQKDTGKCSDCHENEVKAWEGSHHFKSLDILNDDTEGKAKEILTALKLKGKATDQALCASCHFTDKLSVTKPVKPMPEMGISCESCHQPAKGWVNLHSLASWKEFEDKLKQSYSQESTAEGQAEVLASYNLSKMDDLTALKAKDFKTWMKSSVHKAGMIRPAETYALINNCYTCHTVGNANLINNSKHTPGSSFEIISWLNGEVRHNFHGSDSQNPVNKKMPIERQRELYVAGQFLYIEHALRALQNAEFPSGKEKSVFFKKMSARWKRGARNFKKLAKSLGGKVKEVEEFNKLVQAKYKTLEKADLADLIVKAKELNMAFIADQSNRSQLSVLDKTLGKVKAKGEAYLEQ